MSKKRKVEDRMAGLAGRVPAVEGIVEGVSVGEIVGMGTSKSATSSRPGPENGGNSRSLADTK